MKLPAPRGPLGAWLFDLMSGSTEVAAMPDVPADADPLDDDDLHLSLATCYAVLTYGIDGVDDAWEWDPTVVAFRRFLERRFEGALREEVDLEAPWAPNEVPHRLVSLSRDDEGPSLSRFLAREATIEQFREFVIHRSIYTLHEADPHTFVIPRLEARTKAALVEIQADEYGGGSVSRMHARLFADAMEGLGLDPRPDAYVDLVGGPTLATVNLAWMLGLQRRLRGAAVGHLALFELTSAVPNRAYGNGLRRLGVGTDVTRYYDEHVEADSVHDMVAAFDLAGSLAVDEPSQVPQIALGASALHLLERRFAASLMDPWSVGKSSLRARVPIAG